MEKTNSDTLLPPLPDIPVAVLLTHNYMVLPGYKHWVHTQDPELVVAVIEQIYRKAREKPGGH